MLGTTLARTNPIAVFHISTASTKKEKKKQKKKERLLLLLSTYYKISLHFEPISGRLSIEHAVIEMPADRIAVTYR